MRATDSALSSRDEDSLIVNHGSGSTGQEERGDLALCKQKTILVLVLLTALGFMAMKHPHRALATEAQGNSSTQKKAEQSENRPAATVKVKVEAPDTASGAQDSYTKPSATVKVEVETQAKSDATIVDAKLLPPPDKQIAPVKTEAIDEAGKELGKKIEDLGSGAGRVLGQWVNAEAFRGITWLKLICCMFMLAAVFLVDRLFGLLIHWRRQRISARSNGVSWRLVVLGALSGPVRLFIYVYGSYAAVSPLFVHFEEPFGPTFLHDAAEKAADIGGGFAVVWFAYGLVKLVDLRLGKRAKALAGDVDDLATSILGKTLRFAVAVLGGILILQNLSGVEVGPLIASLGIGGLAIALAAKEPLSNIFGTFTVLFDKPFKVGDWIRIDGQDGTVESVGYRSTRVRTWEGHLVSVPNQKVVTSSVDNVSQSPHLRWHTSIELRYDTTSAKLTRALEIIGEVLAHHPGMNEDYPPKIYFAGFESWRFKILVYAWYHPRSFWDYNQWVHEMWLQIQRRFEAEGIRFGVPPNVGIQGEGSRDSANRDITGYGPCGAPGRPWPLAS